MRAKAALLLLLVFGLVIPQAYSYPTKPVKNVIILIGDGMGFGQVQLTEIVYGPLNMEKFPYTGIEKTSTLNTSKGIVDLTTLLELAQWMNKSAGLGTTTRITHATPPVFDSHVPDRDMEKEIARQLIEHNVTCSHGRWEGDVQ
ncbi:alkaline phosphatase [Pyrococcus kukulkanii]|uniref:alkaline phosphatase n=1 Tax=Pyrococcus kukulkanii TaxID=1609559 RepID=UPI003569D656